MVTERVGGLDVHHLPMDVRNVVSMIVSRGCVRLGVKSAINVGVSTIMLECVGVQ